MGKYEPLQRYLETRQSDSWQADFAEIEDVLGFKLPKSARDYYAWWANQTNGSHSHAKSWQEAGWSTRDVNLNARCVRFERTPSAASAKPAARETDLAFGSLAPKLEIAAKLLAVDDHTEIMRMALELLIGRAAGRELVALGGSMPDLQVPQRERPSR